MMKGSVCVFLTISNDIAISDKVRIMYKLHARAKHLLFDCASLLFLTPFNVSKIYSSRNKYIWRLTDTSTYGTLYEFFDHGIHICTCVANNIFISNPVLQCS